MESVLFEETVLNSSIPGENNLPIEGKDDSRAGTFD
jgi:hypothetical protein